MIDNKLREIFVTALGIEAAKITDELSYGSIPEWDSTAHMVLIAEIETQYDIMLDTDDIIDMSSPAKAQSIIAKYQD